MRLINADELLKQIQTTYCKDCKDCNKDKEYFHCCIEQIIGFIHYAPTVDPWHYPSKGEYPPKGKQVLAYAWNVHNVLAKYDTFDGKDIFVTFDAYNGFIEIKKVVRWQYIIPPQEEA